MSNRLIRMTAAASCALALIASGCGSDGGGGGAAGDGGEVKTIRVSTQPVYVVLNQYLARDKGWFGDLKVESVPVEKSSAAQAALASGDLQFAYCAYQQAFQAIAGGFQELIVAPGNAYGPGIQNLVVKKDGPIRTPQDMAGKTIGVTTPGGSSDFLLRVWLEANGVDPKSVKAATVPFPQQAEAIQKGTIDAASLQEPYLSPAMATGNFRGLGDTSLAIGPHGEVDFGGYCASRDFVEQNPETVKQFVDGITRANKFATGNPTDPAVVKAVAQAAGLSEAEAKETEIGPFLSAFNVPSLQKQIDLGVKLDFVPKSLKADDILWKDAPRATSAAE